MNSQTARWQQWADAMRIGPKVAALVVDPSAPTIQDHRRWLEQHRYPAPVPAPPEIVERARLASIARGEEISGVFVYKGRAYQLPPFRGFGRPRTFGATGEITRCW